LADIFAGNIKRWTDQRIMDLNPNLPWKLVDASQAINVVVRADSSGTTELFSKSLSTCDKTRCDFTVTPGLDVAWTAPQLTLATGNEGVVSAVANSEWSIGYATFGAVNNWQEVADQRVHCTAIKKSDEVQTVEAAWVKGQEWPFIQTSYLMVPRKSVDFPEKVARRDECASRVALHDYLQMLYQEHDVAAASYLKLSQPPADLDSILCPNTQVRRLKESNNKCKKTSAMCQQVKMVGYIDTSLPQPVLPRPKTPVSLSMLFVNGLLLASVALLEHVANVKLYADKKDYNVWLSSDLVAVGMANVVGSLCGCFISAGGFSRSALNADAKTQASGLLSVVFSFLIVLALSPVLSMLPHAALNVILFVAVASLVDTKIVRELVALRKKGLQDLVALVTAFAATCFLGVVQGMIIAISFSLVMFIFNSTYPEIVELRRVKGSSNYRANRQTDSKGNACGFKLSSTKFSSAPIKVLRFEAAMWFANVTRLVDVILAELRTKRLYGLVLDMSSVPRMDTTAAAAVNKLLKRFEQEGVHFLFAHTNEDVKGMLKEACSVADALFYVEVVQADIALQDRQLEEGKQADCPDEMAEIDEILATDANHREAEMAQHQVCDEILAPDRNHRETQNVKDAAMDSASGEDLAAAGAEVGI